jgi:hypothetical protein
MWTAASEFNMATGAEAPVSGGTGGGAGPLPAASPLASSVQRSVLGHPRLALGVLTFGAIGLAAYATKPIAGGSITAHVGPASGSIEGEV